MNIQQRTTLLWVFALLGFILSLFGNVLASKLGYDHYFRKKEENIFDLGHTLLPKIETQAYDFIVLGVPLLYVIFRGAMKGRLHIDLFRETVFCFGLVLLFRVLTTVSTILPTGGETLEEACSLDNYTVGNYLFGGCYDKIFSGHTSFVFILCLTALKFDILTKKEVALVMAYSTFLIVSTHSHYTVDVLLALIISYGTFLFQYNFINNHRFLVDAYDHRGKKLKKFVL